MSESDSFINEVAEEVRRERLSRFLRRYGWLIGAVLLAIVGGVAWNEWSRARDAAAAEATGDALRAALDTADPAARAVALASLPAGPADAVARFAEAGALLETGDAVAAAAILAALAEDARTPEVLRGLAALQRVMALGSTLEPSERIATLDALAADAAPFRLLALEQRALSRIETGETEAARADLETVTRAPLAPEGLRGRTQQLLTALGGPLEPAEPDAGTIPAGTPGTTPGSGG